MTFDDGWIHSGKITINSLLQNQVYKSAYHSGQGSADTAFVFSLILEKPGKSGLCNRYLLGPNAIRTIS